MSNPGWIAAVRPIVAAACLAGLLQGAKATLAQVPRPWSDVQNVSGWEDTVVGLLVPGSSTSSDVIQLPAKTITVRLPSGDSHSLWAIFEPGTRETFVLGGRRYLVLTKAGISSIRLDQS